MVQAIELELVTKDNAKSKADVKNMKSTKASSKATVASKTAKASKADDLKSKKTTKATSKATLASKTEKGEKAANIKASHSVSFMELADVYCSICEDMPDSDCYANLEQLYDLLDYRDKLHFLRDSYPNYDTTLSDGDCLTELEAEFDAEDDDSKFEILKKGCVSDLEPTDADYDDYDMEAMNFAVDKDDAKSKDDVKNMKATKATSKATIASKTVKGSKADDLKSEKATKATSKATLANKTQKGEKAANIKASHTVSFMKLDDTYCSICDDMPDSDCYANLQQLYSLLDNKDRLKFLRLAYPNYDTTLSDGDCLTELEAKFEAEDDDTKFDLLKKGCVSDLEPTDADMDDEMVTASFVVDKGDAKSKDDV